MPDISLPSGTVRAPRGPGSKGGRGFRGRGQGGGRAQNRLVAHDIEDARKQRTEDVVTEESREKTFADLLLSAPVLQGLTNSGFVRPSPVQLQAIPKTKVGFDCIVQSKSGTGKTLVYAVTALEMVRPELAALQVLVLAPTREIAVQGVNVAMQIGQQLPNIKIQAFIGGLSVSEDKIRAKTCQIAVGTPGRVKQLISEGLLSVDNVRLAALDEADKMLEPSFIKDTTWILNTLPATKQVLALSATYPDKLATLAERFMRSPQHVRPGQTSQVLSGVAQFMAEVAHCPAQHKQNTIKQSALLALLSALPYTQCLVFSNYTSIAQATADFLNSRGFPAVYMSAVQDQARRMAVMETFRQFNCRILCSTDLTARGIDAENVNLVIQMEAPWDHNTYLHRVGRGGRFGSHSVSVTLASRGQEVDRLRGIVAKTGSEVRILELEQIPSNIRQEMATMELLAVQAEEDEDKTEESSASAKDNTDTRDLNNSNSKLSSIDKKKNVSHTKKNNEEEDKQILRDYMESLKSSKKEHKGKITFEKVTEISKKLANNESVEDIEIVEYVGPSEESSELAGKAIERLALVKQKEFNSKLQSVKSKTKDMNVDEMLALLENGGYRTMKDACTSNQSKSVDSVELGMVHMSLAEPGEEGPNSHKSDASDSETSSSDSESDSDSSSSSESDSDSETSSEEDEDSSQVNQHPGLWYQQWYQNVYHQRQLIQMNEYYRYLQSMGYHL